MGEREREEEGEEEVEGAKDGWRVAADGEEGDGGGRWGGTGEQGQTARKTNGEKANDIPSFLRQRQVCERLSPGAPWVLREISTLHK